MVTMLYSALMLLICGDLLILWFPGSFLPIFSCVRSNTALQAEVRDSGQSV